MTIGRLARGRSVTLAYVESAEPMGQQEYETQLIAALTEEGLVGMRVLPFSGLRAPSPTGRRVWLGGASHLPPLANSILARQAYGRHGLVHRLDGRLPSTRGEVLTIHDLAPMRFEDEGDWPGRATAAARRAAAVVVPSRSSAQDVRSMLRVERVHVIPYGVDPACWDAGELTREDRCRLGLTDTRYVVYAGGSTRRKNLPALAEAWGRFTLVAPDLELLICGPLSEVKHELFGSLPRSRVLGKLPRGQLLRLMASAAAIVVPSVYEGFGLPVLEAMATGTVVVAARTSSLPEIAGDVAVLVDPSAQGLEQGIALAVDASGDRRIAAGRRWARHFDWRETARRHVALYASLADEAAVRGEAAL